MSDHEICGELTRSGKMKLALQHQTVSRRILADKTKLNSNLATLFPLARCLLPLFVLVSTRYSVRRIQSRRQYFLTHSSAVDQ